MFIKKTIPQLILVLVAIFFAGCKSVSNPITAPKRAVSPKITFELPTPQPTLKPLPTYTRVLPLPNWTPKPTATVTPIPDETWGLVVKVIDSNSIAVVMDGDLTNRAYELRYIGINPPPANSPWEQVAYEKNRNLTSLKVVRLVRDQTDFDEDGYLLRHVYIDDQLVSIILAEQGLARVVANSEPNSLFAKEILAAEQSARKGRLGLWGKDPTPTPTKKNVPPTLTPTSTDVPIITATPQPDNSSELKGPQ